MTTEIILGGDGLVKRREITERIINLGPQAFDRLAAAKTLRVRYLLEDPEMGTVHANIKEEYCLLSIEMEKLMLKTSFLLSGGVMVPDFGRDSTPMALEWTVPDSIKLRLAAQIQFDANREVWFQNRMWLFAFGSNNAAWRMPLANIYDDCSLCTGEFDSRAPSVVGSLRKGFRQFTESKWNADLWKDYEKTQRFFRFDPSTTPFRTLPVDNTAWTNLCLKVATPITEQVII